MLKTVKAKFTDGVLVPLEPLDMAEDEIVSITVETGERFKDWKGTDWTPTTEVEIQEAEAAADEMIRFIYRARHRGIDCDCIYCAPKR